MIAQAQQHRLTIRKIFRLVNGVAVAFLLVLHCERELLLKIAHLVRFLEQRRIFLQPLQVILTRPLQICAHQRVLTRLHNDADFGNARCMQFQQMIME